MLEINHSLIVESTNAIIGKPFITLNSVDSTNNYAMQAIKDGAAKHGTAYFAFEQTAGKGQRNKQWLSVKGQNIMLSIVLDIKSLSVDRKFYLNVISALAVKNLFNKYTAEIIKIKWTNDIYYRDRKTAGILIENVIKGDKIIHSVVGFGININQTDFDAQLKNPVSLKQITGKEYDVIKLAKKLCSLFNEKYCQLIKGDLNALINEYNEYLYKKNELVTFKKSDALFKGRVINVDDAGRLIVETSHKEAFEFGSIEWIIE